MAYTQITFLEAKQRLSRLLGDSGMVFFTDAELGRYIKESLRTWNTMAQYYKSRGQFPTTSGNAFYDIGPILSDGSSLLVDRTVTDVDILADICDALMETAPFVGAWTGTDKFDMPSVLRALEESRDQFIYQTSCLNYVINQAVAIASPEGRLTLTDQNISDIRRVDWFSNGTNKWKQLWREDEWSFDTTRYNWDINQDEPEAYSIAITDPLHLQFSPVPSNGGHISLLCVKNIDPVAGVGTRIDIPSDFAWAIKYGALAILLNEDGQVRDPERVAYCQQRWKEAIALATGMDGTILRTVLNGTKKSSAGFVDLDSCNPNWRNTSGLPESAAIGGFNIIALSPVPDAVYSVLCDVIRNAPIPTLDADYIDIGREYIDPILGFAQHIASFKMGGAEFQATQQLQQDMIDAAMSYNAELQANAKFIKTLEERARIELQYRPPKEVMQNGNT